MDFGVFCFISYQETPKNINVIIPLINSDFTYYECFKKKMPYRRFFVKHKVNPAKFALPKIIKEKEAIVGSTEEHCRRMAHIHILPLNSEHWIRYIAFRS